jgi:hypothetical protein
MMSCYFTDIVVDKRRGRKPTSLPQILDQDIERAGCGNLRNDVDLEILRMKAHNFEEWDQRKSNTRESQEDRKEGETSASGTRTCKEETNQK